MLLLEASLLSTSTFSNVADSKIFYEDVAGKKASGKENRYFQEQYFPKKSSTAVDLKRKRYA